MCRKSVLTEFEKPCSTAILRHFLNQGASLWGDAQNDINKAL